MMQDSYFVQRPLLVGLVKAIVFVLCGLCYSGRCVRKGACLSNIKLCV